MKVGITLPQFGDDAELAIEVARQAEAAGIDGVFVFDHLWAIGQPERPAIHSLPLLGALAAETSTMTIGTLVSRVGLLPAAVLVNALGSVHRMVGDRLIAGVGAGDSLSKAENLAYDVPFDPAAVRLAEVAEVVAALREKGITTWVGGRSPETRRIAVDHADALNLWDAPPGDVAAEKAVPVTWGGVVRPDDSVPALLAALSEAGAVWAVLAPAGFEWAEAVSVIGAAAGVARQ